MIEKIFDDTEFWRENRGLFCHQRLVWMLFYEMQKTNFAHSDARSEVVKEIGLCEAEQALMQSKSQLTASLSKLFNAGSAATLGTAILLRSFKHSIAFPNF